MVELLNGGFLKDDVSIVLRKWFSREKEIGDVW